MGYTLSFENIGKRETLPEKVCRIIKESILSGELKGGDALPTEPELESQFGVSRAVIRDAVRMLKGQGLIEIQHGKGMFVSSSQIEAFTDALLTSLRRDKASVWDVEEYERIFLPLVFSLAAQSSTREEKEEVRELGERYLDHFETLCKFENSIETEMTQAETHATQAFSRFMMSIFDATHNKMIRLMGEVLMNMRKWRTITEADTGDNGILKTENMVIRKYIEAVECRDGQKAMDLVLPIFLYDEEMADIMRKTPIGTSPEIPFAIFNKGYAHLD